VPSAHMQAPATSAAATRRRTRSITAPIGAVARFL
jgi:hypothetical protein